MDISNTIEAAKRILKRHKSLLRLHGDFVIVGDIHGNMETIHKLFNKPLEGNMKFLFLGDLIDRGQDSFGVVKAIFEKMVEYPERIFVIRGNHESRLGERSSASSLYKEMSSNTELYEKIINLFENLPLAAVLNSKYFCVHGGISEDVRSLGDIENIKLPLSLDNRKGTAYKAACGLLWSDPSKSVTQYEQSPRKNGALFGKKPLTKFLKKNKLSCMIRGHQWSPSGFSKEFDDNSLLTLASSENHNNTPCLASCAILNEVSGPIRKIL